MRGVSSSDTGEWDKSGKSRKKIATRDFAKGLSDKWNPREGEGTSSVLLALSIDFRYPPGMTPSTKDCLLSIQLRFIKQTY